MQQLASSSCPVYLLLIACKIIFANSVTIVVCLRIYICSSVIQSGITVYKSGLERLHYRRDVITQKKFEEINDTQHPLHYLLPPVKVSNSQMVNGRHISIPIATKQKFSLWTKLI